MVFLFGALMVAAVVGLVSIPLLKPDPRSLQEVFEIDENASLDLERRRAALIDAIKDVDFDLQTGKLSSRDHRLLRARFEKEVFALYREMDERGQEASLLDEIEQEVSKLREGTRPAKGEPLSCPVCDGRVPSGARYCPFCGVELGGSKR
ncbi:MAG: hypothetical protein ACE5JS_01215 [Nitrospinota bacterium]